MSQDDFVTVFDVSSHPYQGWIWPILATLFAFGFLVSLYRARGGRESFLRLPLIMMLGISIALPAWYFTWRKFEHFRKALQSGKTQYVEGRVTDFTSLPKSESFQVKGNRFTYSDDVITEAFNSTARRGGPIHEGVQVRIWFVKNSILKLDIERK